MLVHRNKVKIMDENENVIINQVWFELYLNEIYYFPFKGFITFHKYFLCLCCYFPTLTERQDFEICLLCNWEDDGQDNYNADEVIGGANRNYSLTEARNNFEKYLTSYRPCDSYRFERTTIKKTLYGKISGDLNELKMKIINKYNLLITLKDIDEFNQIFFELKILKAKLNSL